MPNLSKLQTSFAAGEIDERLFGRTDLKAYAEGAARLRNVWVTVGGGVRRRAGMRHLADVEGPGRLAVTVVDEGKVRLFVLADGAVHVFEDGAPIATVAAPWTAADLPSLSWAHYRGGLLICHRRLPPQRVFFEPDAGWRAMPWSFDTKSGAGNGLAVHLQPYAKYAPPEATLEAFAEDGRVWSLRSNQRVFGPAHVGTRLRFRDAEVLVQDVSSNGTRARGPAQTDIDNPARTYDWAEQAFSPAVGYPGTCLVFRERLVVAGVPARANRLWMSKIGRPFNFDLGSGLDDEAISFELGDDPAHAIQALSAGRELEIFTSASEWTVDGNPLAPASTIAIRQTGIGSGVSRRVQPVDVDGASVFLGRGGDNLIEYVFNDIDTAYQAQDLTVRARHLLKAPIDLAFDSRRRLLMVVNEDGAITTATLDRNAQMVAWTQQRTEGRVLAVAAAAGGIWFLVDRAGAVRLEAVDDEFFVDAGVTRTAAAPATDWAGLEHLEGRTVAVVGDGRDLGTATVANGRLRLGAQVQSIVVGIPYRHEIEPLPLVVNGQHAELYRPLEIALQLQNTPVVQVDLGEGLATHELASPDGAGFTGKKRLSARGWRRANAGPLWRIEGDQPLPLHLLSATADVKVTR